MDVFARIEGAYLNILRVSIILLATCALGTAVISFVRGWPAVAMHPAQPAHDIKPVLPDLAGYLRDKQAALAGSPDAGGDVTPPLGIGGLKIRHAAQALAAYMKSNFPNKFVAQPEPLLEKALGESRDRIDAKDQEAYADSLVRLSQDINRSRSLHSVADLGSVVAWHESKFRQAVADADRKNAEALSSKAAADSEARHALSLSIVSFVSFLLLIFSFLLVKIERNLRVVHTQVV